MKSLDLNQMENCVGGKKQQPYWCDRPSTGATMLILGATTGMFGAVLFGVAVLAVCTAGGA